MEREIVRLAWLEEYEGNPEKLLKYIPEIKKKGYKGVALHARVGEIDSFRPLASESVAYGLDIWVFTGYMKYIPWYLKEHPEQRVVISSPDGLKSIQWGCPFHPEFKNLYLSFLKEIAGIKGVVAIWVNDEAHLRGGCYCSVCKQDYEREIGGDIPLFSDVSCSSMKEERWRKFIKWRLERWNRVHMEMKEVINSVNPDILTLFQSTPASGDLSGVNPWYSAVSLPWMVEYLDGISVDPYHTAHSHSFHPPEVYISEWCRFLAGIVPENKKSIIITQGFTHPTFSRPLEEKDGLWTSLIPLSCGIDIATAYTYTLMQCSEELSSAYEGVFTFDSIFSKAKPLLYAGLVHSSKTEIFYHQLPYNEETYDIKRLLKLTEILRQYGIPYSYISDLLLEPDLLNQYRVVILPDVACLSEEESDNIIRFYQQGGNLVILGELGCADDEGRPKNMSLLEEILGIQIKKKNLPPHRISFTTEHPVLKNIPSYENTAEQKWIKTIKPQMMLTDCFEIECKRKDVEVIAKFMDGYGTLTDTPAIILLNSKNQEGRIVYFAGFPSRVVHHPEYLTLVRNLTPSVFSEIVKWAAGSSASIRVLNWPPVVPVEKVRPYDTRYINTYEFFPLRGDNFYLAVITSYFKEPSKFVLAADLPENRNISEVKELISGKEIKYKIVEKEIQIPVKFSSKDYIKIFIIRFSDYL